MSRMIMLFVALSICAAPLIFPADLTPILAADRLAVVKPSDFRGVKVTYNAEELSRVLPYIKTSACLFASSAVRHHLRPAKVGFVPCSRTSEFEITISEDLIDVSVSGFAEVDGKKKPFKAVLQHHPTATEVSGYQAIDI